MIIFQYKLYGVVHWYNVYSFHVINGENRFGALSEELETFTLFIIKQFVVFKENN